MSLKSFPHYQQQEAADCGPFCLRMIAKYYGKVYFHSQNIYCRFKSLGLQLIFGLIAGCIIQLILPFLSQAMVDKGINSKYLVFCTE